MKDNEFHYTYSAPTENERREIQDIRSRYEAEEPQNEKMARLRKLDAIVRNTPAAVSLAAGILGCLLFGLGMSFALEFQNYFWGTVFSIVGFMPMLAAYPLYNYVLKRVRRKYSAEILRLSEELLNEKTKDDP